MMSENNFEAEVDGLQQQLRRMPDDLYFARVRESQAKSAYKQTKEDYEFAVIEAQMMATDEQLAGKNAEERKREMEAYLNGHPDVQAARHAMNEAEGDYADAQLDTQRVVDQFSAIRNEARLVGSMLEYLGVGNDAQSEVGSSAHLLLF